MNILEEIQQIVDLASEVSVFDHNMVKHSVPLIQAVQDGKKGEFNRIYLGQVVHGRESYPMICLPTHPHCTAFYSADEKCGDESVNVAKLICKYINS